MAAKRAKKTAGKISGDPKGESDPAAASSGGPGLASTQSLVWVSGLLIFLIGVVFVYMKWFPELRPMLGSRLEAILNAAVAGFAAVLMFGALHSRAGAKVEGQAMPGAISPRVVVKVTGAAVMFILTFIACYLLPQIDLSARGQVVQVALVLPEGSTAPGGVRVVLICGQYNQDKDTDRNGVATFRVPKVDWERTGTLSINHPDLVLPSRATYPGRTDSITLEVVRKAASEVSRVHDWASPSVILSTPVPLPDPTRPNPPQSSTELPLLPTINYAPFRFTSMEVRVDLRQWQPISPESVTERTSPVIWTRRLVGTKTQPIDQIRLYSATEGIAMDVECLSGQPYWIEHALATGRPRVNLMHEYHLIVDISAVPLGGQFDITTRMTAWNGMKEHDPWLAFVAFADIPVAKVHVLFPGHLPYKSRKFVTYPAGQDFEVSAEGLFKQLEDEERSLQLYWEIAPMMKDTTYEIQWEW